MRTRRSRGIVLLLVLALLLVLSLVGASMMRVTLSESLALNVGAQQTVAVVNAQTGVEEALARLRTGTVIGATLPVCTDLAGCPTAVVLNDAAVPSRYQVAIYRRSRSLLTARGNGSAMVVVTATGCAGPNAAPTCGATAAYSSVTEVEVQLPQGGATNSGTYGDD
jgi:hypothetical protein